MTTTGSVQRMHSDSLSLYVKRKLPALGRLWGFKCTSEVDIGCSGGLRSLLWRILIQWGVKVSAAPEPLRVSPLLSGVRARRLHRSKRAPQAIDASASIQGLTRLQHCSGFLFFDTTEASLSSLNMGSDAGDSIAPRGECPISLFVAMQPLFREHRIYLRNIAVFVVLELGFVGSEFSFRF